MEILNALDTVTNTANTLYGFATFNWNKKNVVTLAITATALISATAVIAKINSKKEKSINIDTDDSQCNENI